MPPKRKILSETVGNAGRFTTLKNKGTSTRTRQKREVPESERPEKRQRIEQEETAELDSEAKPTSSPPTANKKRKGQARVDAQDLPPLPSFEPFQSPFKSHKAKVMIVYSCIFAKNTSTSQYFV